MPRPGRFTLWKDPVRIVYKYEAGWTPGPVWTGAENLASTGFDPWTVQPVASRYTDWAIPVHRVTFNMTNYGGGTELQAGRSRVRFPTVSLEFFNDIILPAALRPWGRLSL
jgi:hypothetical protein